MSNIKSRIPSPIKRLYRSVRNEIHSSDKLFDMLYGDSLTITSKEFDMEFDTSSMVAKRWFYPRYRDGSMHEPVVSQALLDILEEDSVFFDVGSNVGFYTVLASKACSEVHAFEMDPRLATIVSQHFEKTKGKNGDVKIIPAPISETSGNLITFTPHQTDNLSTNAVNIGRTEKRSRSNFQTQTLSVDDYVMKSEVQPDMVKIDVEGFELSVLKGLSDSIDEVKGLLIEIHPSLLNQYGRDASEVLDLLHRYGFTVQQFTNHRSTGNPEESLEEIEIDHSIEQNGILLCTK